jgi:hypothetical protein
MLEEQHTEVDAGQADSCGWMERGEERTEQLLRSEAPTIKQVRLLKWEMAMCSIRASVRSMD